MKKFLTLFCLINLYVITAHAQGIVWDSSSDRRLTFLKGVNHMNVEYIYDGVMINGKSEAEFLDTRQEEFNDKKKGRGDNFVEHWQEVKLKRYPEHFEKAFKRMAKKSMKIARGDKDKYTMQVKVIKAKTGEGIIVKNVPANAEFEISFLDTETGKVMAKARILNAKGIVKAKTNLGTQGSIMRVVASSMNTDVANRLAKCYESAATSMAKYVIRFNKKKEVIS